MQENNMLGFHEMPATEFAEVEIFYSHPLEKIEKGEPVIAGELIEILKTLPLDLPMYFFDDNADIMGICDVSKTKKAVYFNLF